MKFKYDHIASTHYLSNLGKDDTPLRGRIATLSVQTNDFTKYTDQIITFIEYSQMIVLLLLSNYKLYPEHNTHSIEIYNLIQWATKVISPGNYLPQSPEGWKTVKLVLGLCLLSYIFRVLLFLYIIWLAWKRKRGPQFLINIWQWIFRLQGKVFHFIFASLWTNAYDQAYKDSFGLAFHDKVSFMFICCLMLVLEFSLSITIITQFNNVLPYKRFSAAKDNYSELSLLIQKFTIHILRRGINLETVPQVWLYGVINIIFGAARIYHTFKKLQIYNYQALRFQLSFFISTLMFPVCTIAQVILNSNKIDMNFTLGSWIILTIFSIKLAHNSLERRLIILAFEKGINKTRSPEALAHRTIILNQILKQNQLPAWTSEKYDLAHLFYSSINIKVQSCLKLDSINWSDKTVRNKIFTDYIEELIAKFPENNFLKLYAAYRYARKGKLYGLAIKTLAELKNSSYPTVVVSKSILMNSMKMRTQSDYQNGTYRLNLYDYCENLGKLARLKLRMVEQAKFQFKICNEIVGTSPDLAKISSMGCRAYSQKMKIQKNIVKMTGNMSEYYLEPYLLYAAYSLYLGYSTEEASKFQELYTKKSSNYEKWFESNRVTPENLFQEKNLLIVLSGEKETFGVVTYTSANVQDVMGRNVSGKLASAIAPPVIQGMGAGLLKILAGQNALTVQNTDRTQYLYHQKGYIVPANYYININPSLYGGLSFICAARVDKASKELILLNEEGEIETFTKNLGDIFGLFSKDGVYSSDKKIRISQICPELSQVNKAFNIGVFPDRYLGGSRGGSSFGKTKGFNSENLPEMKQEEVERICSVYSSADQGNNITLDHNGVKLTYRCFVKPLVIENRVAKILTLEKIYDPQMLPNDEEERKDDISAEMPSAIDEHDDDDDRREDKNSEKGSAWIDFERLKSEPRTQTYTRRDYDPHVQNTLSSARNFLTLRNPTSPLLTEKRRSSMDKLYKHDSIETFTSPNELMISAGDETPHKTSLLNYKPHYSGVKTTKLYQQALEKSYFPFFYRILLAFLYTIAITVFVMYLTTAVNMHEGISELEVSKQILRIAEGRNNYLGTVAGALRVIWLYATYPENAANFTTGIAPLLNFIPFTKNIINGLEEANNELFILASTLDGQERDFLFENDVIVVNSVSTDDALAVMNMTSFQATKRVIETSLKIFDIAKINATLALPYLDMMLSNLLNDMLTKNNRISDAFKTTLADRKDYFSTWITNYLAISVSFVVLITFGFAYVLYLQSKSELNNLFALTKLKPESIHTLKQNLLVFRNIVFNHDCSQNRDIDPFYSESAKLYSKAPQDLKKQHLQYPISRGLWLEYYLYLLKVVALVTLLIGIFVANFLLFKSYLDKLALRANQIHFVEQMNSRLSLLSGSFLELIAENNSTILLGMQADQGVIFQMDRLSGMIQDVSNTIGVGTSQEYPLIQDVLYGDSCQYLNAVPKYFGMCNKLANYQTKAGLTNLLSNFDAIAETLYQKFAVSDRSHDVLIALTMESFNTIGQTSFLVLQALNKLIAELLNEDFEEIVTQSQSLDVSLNAGILVLIVLECLIIHFFIINKLRRKENEFKRILGLFPAHIVLPNFILKSYIMKSSNQTFNSFRDSNA